MRGLLDQIKRDHEDLIGLEERLSGANEVNSEIDEILKKISWIKESIAYLKYLKSNEIEGICLSGTKRIENDLVIKEVLLRETLRTIS